MTLKQLSNCGYVYDHAIRFKRASTHIPQKNQISKRGLITKFTRHTALRLRDALSQNTIPNSETYGITLTVPWKVDDILFDSRLNRYRECFHRFTISLSRRLPNSASIFRHELQQRKMPHTHLIIWLSHLDGSQFRKGDLLALVLSLWARAMQGELYGGDINHFFKYGVKVDPLFSNVAMMRYLCDHTAKSKQAQLGYIGKQWGYINRKMFVCPGVHSFHMSNDQAIKLSRQLSRFSRFSYNKRDSWCKCDGQKFGLHLGRYHIMKRSCPFGVKKISRHRLNSVLFIARHTALKLFRYLGIEYCEFDPDRKF